MDDAQPRVLVVDDDAAVLDSLEAALKVLGYHVLAVSTGAAALAAAREERPDAVILDFNMPDMDGLGLVTALRNAGIIAPAVMISGATRNGAFNMLKREAEGLGITATFMKPFSLEELDRALKTSIALVDNRS